MTLVNGIDILRTARREGYAVGGFDVFGLESIQAVLAAAEELNSPVFLQACVRSVEHMGVERVGAIMRDAARRACVPVAVHFDHGPQPTSLQDILRCLESGFTSIMLDGSRLPLERNIEITHEAVRLAHLFGATAEGEIGKIGRITGGQADEVAFRMTRTGAPRDWLTTPEEASHFVTETGVDYVALSVGSISGSSAPLDLDLLKELAQRITIPLVLHGGSGVSEEDLGKAVSLGVARVNIAHGIRRTFIRVLREDLADGQNTDNPYLLLSKARTAMKDYVAGKIVQLRGGR
jgi:fructose-bisphosphate aldolase class II